MTLTFVNIEALGVIELRHVKTDMVIMRHESEVVNEIH